ncbi:MAG: HAD family phosphatase [Deltaproteobacteria bacterium]|nr:HAD family phosphatase [Deltaproteobacteria bacterium]
MIKAVIFDWGGVLIENPAPAMLSYFAASLGVAEGALNSAYAEFLPEFQKGLVTEDALWRIICRKLGVSNPYVPSLWEEAFKQAYQPREEMFLLVPALRKDGYRVGLLSNTEKSAARVFQEMHRDVFDTTVFSCDEGTWKPEPEIYQIALNRMKVQPEEAIFVDDREDFIEGAATVGIRTILYRTSGQVQKDLDRLLGKTG